MSCRLPAAKAQTILRTELAAKGREHVVGRCGILRIGEKPADIAYEQSLLKQLPQYGITPVPRQLPATASPKEVKSILTTWNRNPEINGILPLLPFPPQLTEALEIAPQKDIDGVCSHEFFYPCTPQAVMIYLKACGITVAGKKATVLGRSPRVGQPLAELLRHAGAEVTVVHSRTEHPAAIIRANDLVFSAVGKPRFLNGDFLREHQTVIDIGINADPEHPGKICGDLDESCAEALDLTYTPVPGGIGSITTLVLIHHILKATSFR